MIRRLEVEYRKSASGDLAATFRHMAEASGSADIALKFVLRIEDRCQNIGNAPLAGRRSDDTAPDRPIIVMDFYSRTSMIAVAVPTFSSFPDSFLLVSLQVSGQPRVARRNSSQCRRQAESRATPLRGD